MRYAFTFLGDISKILRAPKCPELFISGPYPLDLIVKFGQFYLYGRISECPENVRNAGLPDICWCSKNSNNQCKHSFYYYGTCARGFHTLNVDGTTCSCDVLLYHRKKVYVRINKGCFRRFSLNSWPQNLSAYAHLWRIRLMRCYKKRLKYL